MSSDGDSGEWAASESKDWKDGRHRRENEHVLAHAGEVPRQRSRRTLSKMHQAYERAYQRGWLGEGFPPSFQETQLYRDLMSHHATEGFSEAIAEGDAAGVRHYVGSQEDPPDISGLKAIGKVDDLITGPAPVIVILGEMGDGKTDFAGLLGQRWSDHQPSDRLVGTNIRSLEEKTEWVDEDGEVRSGWIRSYGELMEWVQQDGDPLEYSQRSKLFIGDEFSSAASGRGKQGYETATKMTPLVYKIRKYGGALIYIAHGPKSIHPMLWRVGTIVKKTSKKKAVVADRIRSGKVADVQFEIEGIPPTDWTFRTEEASEWSWSETGSEEVYEPEQAAKDTAIWTVIRCKEAGMTDRETAKFVPYSHGWVNSRWQEHREGRKHDETLAKVEEVIA
ncbi:hypothetical protein AArcSl_3075 [Halalkaliarchaeum desulfuricum]|uniref:Uncharacterized protein n=1 Tax=Halalkaliarchaeum desulfuricum TaxID=2055893 RepID=A0A343TNL0_9EURY|nr:hypothetical protein [Halalkaliarchaeum desulfuricum]AUX10682.1 hypothetical protein AArcSl_3075 [Halalkaliarchaeum desulfuricum]